MAHRAPRLDDPAPPGGIRGAVWLAALAGALLGAPTAEQSPLRQPPVIVSFAAGDSGATVSAGTPVPLVHRVVGARPTHYRVSVRTDFAQAAWLPYQAQPVWQASAEGTGAQCGDRAGGVAVRLYFQVRTVLGHEVRIVDGHRVLTPMATESNVQTGIVCVLAAPAGGRG